MDTIFHRLQRNIEKINESVIMEGLLQNSDVTDAMITLQREQMLDNKNAEGQSFGGYKKATEGYNSKRSTKVTAGDPIILKDTGAFESKIDAIVQKDKAKLTSTDSKTDMIKEMYGEEVFGLSKEYMGQLQLFIKQSNLPQKILKDLMLYGN
jgi:hypothetical protein